MKNLLNEKGYALIEGIFIITVLAILSSIVVPKIAASLQTVQADYFMKTLYSEVRFIQAARRVSLNDEDDVFDLQFQTNNFVVGCLNQNIGVRINKEIYRDYEMPSTFSFEGNGSVNVSSRGILSYQGSVSTTIRLKNNSQILKPTIVFDSVGRIRFNSK